MTKVLFDTNVFVGWIRDGRFESLFLGQGLIRHLSAVVYMELQSGAQTRRAAGALERMMADYRAASRFAIPPISAYERAGGVLRRLRARGHEIRAASLVHDVLIAETARAIGATVYTADADYEAIRAVEAFDLHLLR